MRCPGTMVNGPGKRYTRCTFCNKIDYETNEGDRCPRQQPEDMFNRLVKGGAS